MLTATLRPFATVLALAVMVGATGATGCRSRPCRDGTVLLTLQFDDLSGSADQLEVRVTVGGGEKVSTLPYAGGGAGEGTIEITFPNGYPGGQSVALQIQARRGALLVGDAGGGVALPVAGCGALALAVPGRPCTPLQACPARACGTISDECGGTLSCDPCALTAVHPALAMAGSAVVLEGRFGAAATVTFPGGATAEATVLGEGRAEVRVPDGAGEGTLRVTSNGSTTAALPFRRVTYRPGLLPFRDQYEQVEYGRQAPHFGGPRFYGAVVATERRLWVIGGMGLGAGTSYEGDAIDEALINADGTLGAFRTLDVKLVARRRNHTAVRLGDWIYVVGGMQLQGADPDTPWDSVERAPILADGTLGAFSLVPGVTLKATLTVGPATYRGRWGHAAAVAGGWLYVIGGRIGDLCNNPKVLASVERAPIDGAGGLGDFVVAPAGLATPREGAAAEVRGDGLYVIGGRTDAGPLGSIERAPILGDGSLAAFTDGGGPLPEGRFEPRALVLDDALYVVGGGRLTTLRAAFAADGRLAAFTEVARAALPPAFDGVSPMAVLAVGNHAWAVGGGYEFHCNAAAIGGTDQVARASLVAGSQLGPFLSSARANLAPTRTVPAVLAAGDRVYAIGGPGTTGDEVVVALLQPDGTLGDFQASGTHLVEARTAPGVAVLGQAVYVAGGTRGAGGGLATVEIAPIGADGRLGAFAAATVSLDRPRTRPTLVVVRNRVDRDRVEYLCAVGGDGDGGTGSTVACAEVGTGGTLTGSFQQPSLPVVLGVARAAPGLLLVSPSLFVLGGAPTPDGDRVAIETGDQPRPFSGGASTISGLDLGYFPALGLVGDALFATGGGWGLVQASVTVSRSPLDPSGAPGLFVDVATLPFAHGGHRSLTVGTHVYLLGGSNSSGAADTEIAEIR